MSKNRNRRLYHLPGAVACFLLALVFPALGETVTANLAEAIDGDTVILNGRYLNLSGIVAPAPGFVCKIRNLEVDCGSIARAGLLDLMAGSMVTCDSDGNEWRCSVGGFDLAENMVHTGWAVPKSDNDPRFAVRLERAMLRNQGLWRATPRLTIDEIRCAGAR